MVTETLTDDKQTEAAEAQYLVASRLVQACQQAIYELALDDDQPPAVRQNAIRVLKEIGQDWAAARRELRQEIRAASPQTATFTAR